MPIDTIPPFFVPGNAEGQPAERAYERLRDRAKRDIGANIRQRRIFALHCRFEGQDRHFQVGEPTEPDGPNVVAIFECTTGMRYHVYREMSPPVAFKSVYSVTEFS
ncbi:MAG: hypothetical protein JHC95_13200 [Solirubrobacteraceae bacterium]|nr:hypothetical protein [Solirubrobacteraceae bacterium]